jgi:hypothetical protein
MKFPHQKNASKSGMKCTQQQYVERNRFQKRFIPVRKSRKMGLNKLPETASKSGVTGRKEKMMFE